MAWGKDPFPVGRVEGLGEANIRSQLERIEKLVREVLEKLQTRKED